MTTRMRKSPAGPGRRLTFAEARAIRQQIGQLETLHATLNAVDSKLLALVATYRPSLLKKRKYLKTLSAAPRHSEELAARNGQATTRVAGEQAGRGDEGLDLHRRVEADRRPGPPQGVHQPGGRRWVV